MESTKNERDWLLVRGLARKTRGSVAYAEPSWNGRFLEANAEDGLSTCDSSGYEIGIRAEKRLNIQEVRRHLSCVDTSCPVGYAVHNGMSGNSQRNRHAGGVSAPVLDLTLG